MHPFPPFGKGNHGPAPGAIISHPLPNISLPLSHLKGTLLLPISKQVAVVRRKNGQRFASPLLPRIREGGTSLAPQEGNLKAISSCFTRACISLLGRNNASALFLCYKRSAVPPSRPFPPSAGTTLQPAPLNLGTCPFLKGRPPFTPRSVFKNLSCRTNEVRLILCTRDHSSAGVASSPPPA